MASPCNNDPNEVIEKVALVKSASEKLDKFINGTSSETVQLGTGAATPTIRNAYSQLTSQTFANAQKFDQFVNGGADETVRLNGVATPTIRNAVNMIKNSSFSNAQKFNQFVNGTAEETVQLGDGPATPTIRNAIAKVVADASWARQHIADAPEGDVSLNNAAAMGATASRTLAERFSDIVNVKDFGAVGDGVTDDTEAILSAVAKHGIIFLPAGTYIVSSPIGLPSNTYLVGAGKNATIIAASSSMDLIYHTICTSNCTEIEARSATNDTVDELCSFYVSDSGVSDLTVDGNCYNRIDELRSTEEYLGWEAGTNIEFQRCRNCVISNVRSINGPQHNINIRAGAGSYGQGIDYVSKYPSQYCTIKHCDTDNEMLDDGITTHDSEYIYIYDCQVFLSRNLEGLNPTPIGNGIEIDDGSRYVWVDSCLSVGGAAGYQAKGHDNTPAAKYVWFTHCIARDVGTGFSLSHNQTDTGTGLTEYSCHDIYIISCSIENVYQKNKPEGSSWVTQSHFVFMLNVKNILVKNLTVVGKTGELNDYSTYPRDVFFRHAQRCEDVSYENITLRKMDYNEISNRALFSFEGNCIRMRVHNLICDAWSSGPLISVSSSTARPNFDNIWLLSGSSSYPVVSSSNASNVNATNIFGSGNRCKVLLGGHFPMNAQKNSEDRVYSCALDSGNSYKNSPLQLAGVVSDEGSEAVLGPSSGVRVNCTLTGADGVSRSIGNIQFATRASSYGEQPGSTGTYIGFASLTTSNDLINTLLISTSSVNPDATRDDVMSLGLAEARFTTVYAASPNINTSDEREKTGIAEPDEALMRAWGKVRFCVFQFRDAVKSKGADARLHVGVVAQRVRDAFASEGLDASRYGLFCYDEWEDQHEYVSIVDKEAVLDEFGDEVEPAVTHTERRLVKAAGNRYGIRYAEALALECAYQRWRLGRVEARLNEISGNSSAPSGVSSDNI